MASKRVTTHEAKTHLSRLLSEVEAGNEVVIYRGTTPAARLVPITKKTQRRRPRVGTITSPPIKTTSDAFTPLSDDELEQRDL